MTAVSFGSFVLDLDTRELRRGSESVPLSPKAYQLLEVLVVNGPKALSKSALQERLWPDTFVLEKNLVNLVAEIREALGDNATRPAVRAYGAEIRLCVPAFDIAGTLPPAHECVRTGARFRLVWPGGRAALTDGEYVLGRDPDLELFLDAHDVSRRHARITIAGNDATHRGSQQQERHVRVGSTRRLGYATRRWCVDSCRLGPADVHQQSRIGARLKQSWVPTADLKADAENHGVTNHRKLSSNMRSESNRTGVRPELDEHDLPGKAFRRQTRGIEPLARTTDGGQLPRRALRFRGTQHAHVRGSDRHGNPLEETSPAPIDSFSHVIHFADGTRWPRRGRNVMFRSKAPRDGTDTRQRVGP